ncbi:hypothetical protein O181_049855 [Austropuccinia psidii MF-1]|uniref:Uncharacterized protein n=1 Tax=Austropuccinia psidii MF-1 TaxID=1389203 RepID=A0A9Q3E002_9BASI|nr:hypothetical protein [Austropuccinia psidii MF-1]
MKDFRTERSQMARHPAVFSSSEEGVHPVLLIHVSEASASNLSNQDFELSSNLPHSITRLGLIAPAGKHNTNIPPKKTYKNPNLNISIPPLKDSTRVGLGTSISTSNSQDPVTPVFQTVHTPKIPPGAPGPADPEQIRRLEESWAANMATFGQISPAFPNFQPPTFSDYPIIRPGEEVLESNSFMMGTKVSNGKGKSTAQREMFALTASATTPTFPPSSLSLEFKKSEERNEEA